MATLLTPIFIVGALAILAMVVGMNREIKSLAAVGGVVLVFGGIFVAMALPARLRVEKSFAKLDLLLKNYDASYLEYKALAQRQPPVAYKEKKDFVESQLIVPLDEGLEEISLRSNNVAKKTYASRAALFALHRAGCQFLLLNISMAAEVQELNGKLRSRSLPPTYISNAIASSLIPDLKAGMEKLKSAMPAEGVDVATRAEIAEQTKAFGAEWGRALSAEIIALESQAVHTSLMADLRRFFQLRRQSADPAHHEAEAYLTLEFATHIQQINERWRSMREFLKSADKKSFSGLQREVSNYRGIHDLLVSENREAQITAAFDALTDGWQKKHWSQSQAISYAEREFHSVLPEKNLRGDEGGARNVAAFEPPGAKPPALTENHGEKSGENHIDRLGHDLRMKVRELKLARMHLVETLMKDIKNHNRDFNEEFSEWNQISRSPLKNSMVKAVGVLEQTANSPPN